MLCYGFAAPPTRIGAAPLVRFEGAIPLETVSARAADVFSAWLTAGTPSRYPLRVVDVPSGGTTVTDNQFQSAYSTGRTLGDTTEAFTSLVYQTHTPSSEPAGPPPSADPPGQAGPVDGKQFRTPDGDPYYPPMIGGINGVTLLLTQQAHNRHTALFGPPGSGKTSLAEVAHPDLIQFSFDGGTTDEHLIGQWLPDNDAASGFRWADGPLAVAMTEGRPFLADEIGRTPHETQAVLLPVMDHRRQLQIKTNRNRGTIRAADGFCVILTDNPDSEYGLTAALFDRIKITVDVPTGLSTAVRLSVPAPFVQMARLQEAAAHVSGKTGGVPVWVPSLRTLLDARDNTTLYGMSFAAAALVGSCPDPDTRATIAKKLSQLVNDKIPETGLVATPLP